MRTDSGDSRAPSVSTPGNSSRVSGREPRQAPPEIQSNTTQGPQPKIHPRPNLDTREAAEIKVRVLGHKEPKWLHETINMMVRDIRPISWPKTITLAFAEHACAIESVPAGLCHIHNDPEEKRYYVRLCFAPGVMHAPPPPIWSDEQPTEAVMSLLAKMAGRPPYGDYEQQIKDAEQRLQRRFLKTIKRPLTAYEQALLTAQGPQALWPDVPREPT